MNKKADLAVFIGRFQPFHRGHLYAIHKGLELAETVLVLIGDTQGPRTIKNPWTAHERAQMIYAAVGSDTDRVHCESVIDHPYSDLDWVAGVQAAVTSYSTEAEKIILIGHEKDSSSFYLRMFPQWEFHDTGYEVLENGQIGQYDATAIRNMVFSGRLQYAVGIVPEPVLKMLPMLEPEVLDELREEYAFIKAYRDSWASAPFPPVFVTTDAVVVQSGHVLLVKRGQNPGKGLYALPGGFIDQTEGIDDCAIRELIEETNIKLQPEVLKRCITHVEVFDRRGGVSQEDRGRIITHAHLFQLNDTKSLPKVKGGDDAAEALWVPISEITPKNMFSDHYHILTATLKRI